MWISVSKSNAKKKWLEWFYDYEYRQLYSETIIPTEKLLTGMLELSEERLYFIKDYLNAFSRVLEIGCGEGTFLNLIRKEFACEVYGVNPGKDFAEYGNRKFGLNILPIFFEDTNFDKDFFDLIIICDTFEHFINPAKVLSRISGILKENGILFIDTPNILMPYKNQPVKHLFDYFLIAHTYSFSLKTLTQYLQKFKFNILKTNDIKETSIRVIAMNEKYLSSIFNLKPADYKEVIEVIKKYRIQYFFTKRGFIEEIKNIFKFLLVKMIGESKFQELIKKRYMQKTKN